MILTALSFPALDPSRRSNSTTDETKKNASNGFRLEAGYCWCLTWSLQGYEDGKPELCDSDHLRAVLRSEPSQWPARIYCLRQLDGDVPSWELLPVHSLYDALHPSDRPIFSDTPTPVGFGDLHLKHRIGDDMVILNRHEDQCQAVKTQCFDVEMCSETAHAHAHILRIPT